MEMRREGGIVRTKKPYAKRTIKGWVGVRSPPVVNLSDRTEINGRVRAHSIPRSLQQQEVQ